MKKEVKKILTVSFMIAGILTWLVIGALFDTFAATWGFVARMASNDIVRHGLPVVCGLTVFGSLLFNKNILAWSAEVVSEIQKVVWPSRKDTLGMTVVVCIFLLITGLMVGLFDVFSGYLVNLLVSN